MLVATFGPTTGWAGREIIWDVDRFILVGHGAVPAAGVLDYDRLGQIVWAAPELRPWVAAVARWEAGGRPASSGRTVPYAGSAAGGGAAAGHRGLPAWAIVLLVLGVCFVLLGIVIAAVVPAFVLRTTETLAHDAAVRSGAHTIQAGIEAFAADHNGTYPSAGHVDGVGLSRYISPWPLNPYTDLPMTNGAGAGNFRYERGVTGDSYRIVAFGRDGARIIDLWGGESPQTY